MQVICMVIAVVLYNIPRFFEYTTDCRKSSMEIEIWKTNGENYTVQCEVADCRWMDKNRAYDVIYRNILYFVVVYVGPFIVIIKLNVHIIQELHRPVLNLHDIHQDADDRRNITTVMMVIIGVFLLTQTPGFINQVLNEYLIYECPLAYFYYYHISNLVVSSNSCVNFVIYCACRQGFRRRLQYVFNCSPIQN